MIERVGAPLTAAASGAAAASQLHMPGNVGGEVVSLVCARLSEFRGFVDLFGIKFRFGANWAPGWGIASRFGLRAYTPLTGTWGALRELCSNDAAVHPPYAGLVSLRFHCLGCSARDVVYSNVIFLAALISISWGFKALCRHQHGHVQSRFAFAQWKLDDGRGGRPRESPLCANVLGRRWGGNSACDGREFAECGTVSPEVRDLRCAMQGSSH